MIKSTISTFPGVDPDEIDKAVLKYSKQGTGKV